MSLEAVGRAANVGLGAVAAFDAAKSAFGVDDGVERPDFVADCHELLRRIPTALPLVAQALLNRGVAKGEQEDIDGEIADLTAAVELAGAPADQVALALVNRGITKAQLEDTDGAIVDLTAVVELAGAPAERVAKALVNRGVAKGQQEDIDGAIADYTAVVKLAGAPADLVEFAREESAKLAPKAPTHAP